MYNKILASFFYLTAIQKSCEKFKKFMNSRLPNEPKPVQISYIFWFIERTHHMTFLKEVWSQCCFLSSSSPLYLLVQDAVIFNYWKLLVISSNYFWRLLLEKILFVSFPVFLLLENPINRLPLHQFLGTKTTEVNKSLNTDANEAY